MAKWLILDRDGVINYDSDQFIKSPEEWQPLPGSLKAIANLNKAGYNVVVISNQSGLARGLFNVETLDAIHQKFHTLLANENGKVEKIYYCPHGPDDNCSCRKPMFGLFTQFAQDYKLSLTNVYAVGDSIRDLKAANDAGANSILVRTGKGQKSVATLQTFDKDSLLYATPIYDDLASFVNALLSKEKSL